MMTIVYGGSGSGKSGYAEAIAMNFARDNSDSLNPENCQNTKLFYLATMRVWDEEGKERVAKHRMLREGKGFETIELSKNISDVLSVLQDKDSNIVLLEDLSNLVMNEYYDMARDNYTVSEKIISQILEIKTKCKELIIVSNDIFSDGITYSEEVEQYKSLFSKINYYLCRQAETVTEIVAGIPITLK